MACGRGLLGGHVVVCVAIAMVARASFSVRWVRWMKSLVKHNMLKYGRASLATDGNIVRHIHFYFRISKAPATHAEFVDCV